MLGFSGRHEFHFDFNLRVIGDDTDFVFIMQTVYKVSCAINAAIILSVPMEPERSMTMAKDSGVLFKFCVCGAESLTNNCRFFSAVFCSAFLSGFKDRVRMGCWGCTASCMVWLLFWRVVVWCSPNTYFRLNADLFFWLTKLFMYFSSASKVRICCISSRCV